MAKQLSTWYSAGEKAQYFDNNKYLRGKINFWDESNSARLLKTAIRIDIEANKRKEAFKQFFSN